MPTLPLPSQSFLFSPNPTRTLPYAAAVGHESEEEVKDLIKEEVKASPVGEHDVLETNKGGIRSAMVALTRFMLRSPLAAQTTGREARVL